MLDSVVSALVDASTSLINSGNYTGAIKNLDKALSIDPNNVGALTNKGRALDHLDNYIEATKYIDKALAINPDYVPALENKGIILFDTSNRTEAKKYIDKALSLGRKDRSVNSHDELELTTKGIALRQLGNYTQAIQ